MDRSLLVKVKIQIARAIVLSLLLQWTESLRGLL